MNNIRENLEQNLANPCAMAQHQYLSDTGSILLQLTDSKVVICLCKLHDFDQDFLAEAGLVHVVGIKGGTLKVLHTVQPSWRSVAVLTLEVLSYQYNLAPGLDLGDDQVNQVGHDCAAKNMLSAKIQGL